ERVIADRRDVLELELELLRLDEFDPARVALAAGAWAIAAQDRVRVDAFVAVAPFDRRRARAARRSDRDAFGARVVAHAPRMSRFAVSSATRPVVAPTRAITFSPKIWPAVRARVQFRASRQAALEGVM